MSRFEPFDDQFAESEPRSDELDLANLPRVPRSSALPWVLAVVVVLLLLVVPQIITWTTEWLWYRDVGRTDVFGVMFWGRWLLGGAVTAVFFLLIFGNVFYALRRLPNSTWFEMGYRFSEQFFEIRESTLRRGVLWGSAILTVLFSLLIGRVAADFWPQFLLFAHAKPIGETDPIFSRDIGFYLFRLPVWELLTNWLFVAAVFTLVLMLLVYVTTRGLRALRGQPLISPLAWQHLSALTAFMLLVKALGYYLGRYSVLYTRGQLFTGAGYADVHARLPGLSIMAVLSVVGAVALIVGSRRQQGRIPLLVLGGLFVCSFLLLGVYPGFIQRIRVQPNELKLESPYLANHIALTRRAYGLDKVKTVDFSPGARVSAASLSASPITVKNIRLWDNRPLLQTYKQRQELRAYYQINGVDIDRYTLDGALRQVMVSAREINVDQIPGQQSWLNRHLVYTHGYGVVMSPVNEFDRDKGEPLFFINDVPPKSTDPSLKITRPEIYFGELDNSYAVVNTSLPEFDYPQPGDKTANTVYQGTAGIPLSNLLVRMMMAIRFATPDLLISSYVTPQSRLIYRRQILERAKAVAPFLVFDNDPYIVVGKDGGLYWILDAYTRSIRYPYSSYTDIETADGAIRSNYLRNAVKVVINAYSGTTQLYAMDLNEPFVRAWGGVFPNLFQPLSAMPAGLEQHIRVPQGLFNSLSEIFRRYHMGDVDTFYKNEDLWNIPSESSGEQDASGMSMSAQMEAYYIVMNLPGRSEPEYLLIRPYTPTGENKKNMIAWLSARNDPERLGELLVYNFPKQSAVYGPEQIEARINQTPEISQSLTLWSQAGSRVRKGNLLVIPIAGTVLYVQPLYLRAEQSQIPELKRVIVADQERVVMHDTLEEALSKLIAGVEREKAPPRATISSQPPQTQPSTAANERLPLAKSALEHLKRAKQAQQNGDWAGYGREMEQVQRDLEALNR